MKGRSPGQEKGVCELAGNGEAGGGNGRARANFPSGQGSNFGKRLALRRWGLFRGRTELSFVCILVFVTELRWAADLYV